ncbi:hypothetical protein N9165_01695 [Akkermansiaceae bacterium]|nr:hypothetical protein [Akkermansiaceae bacterium]
MKFKSLIIVSALLGSVSTAYAEKSFGDGTLPEFLQEYDVNEDGKIDEEERQAIKTARKAARDARRAEIDTDGDGEISQEERETARDAIRAAIEAKRAEKFSEIAGEDALISAEELAAIPHLDDASAERIEALFGRLDADESGDITLEEFEARLRHHRLRGHSHADFGHGHGRQTNRPNHHDRPGHEEEPEAPVTPEEPAE